MCDAGGSAYYMEPPAAVALNNERGAARSQVITAEENVLWWLTGLIIDSAPSLQHALEMVRYLAACCLCTSALVQTYHALLGPMQTTWRQICSTHST